MAEKPHILQEGSTFPFLLLNVAEMYAEVAQSILIFFLFVWIWSQNISGRVTFRSSHCWDRLPLQSLMLGTWLSSSVALSRHWLLFTCCRVNFWKRPKKKKKKKVLMWKWKTKSNQNLSPLNHHFWWLLNSSVEKGFCCCCFCNINYLITMEKRHLVKTALRAMWEGERHWVGKLYWASSETT